MTEEQRGILKQKFLSDIANLKKRIDETKEFSEPVSPDNAYGRVSRMDAINNKSIFDSSLRINLERLAKLELALKSVHEKEFGICRKCYTPIPMERLMLRPEIRTCALCV